MTISKVLVGSLTDKAVLVTALFVLFCSTLTGTPLLARTPEARDPNAASVEQNRTCGYGIGDVPQSSKLMRTGAIPATRSNKLAQGAEPVRREIHGAAGPYAVKSSDWCPTEPNTTRYCYCE